MWESRKAASALGLILQPDLDLALELQRERLALAVERLAGGHTDPAFGHAILFDICLFGAVEADTDLTLQQVCIMKLAVGIKGEAVRKRVGHEKLFASESGNCKRSGANGQALFGDEDRVNRK
eukprot:TRINITY_DN75312_c0_g1_i1.p1 TRINITY_DN75312_c0_g1~~TRINITY_DN75312_c0_g1_i1.p1  ORF type:complete len:123 (+),score=15.16 TRINITY_DN75312_c0_g1_i1:153-521(+)